MNRFALTFISLALILVFVAGCSAAPAAVSPQTQIPSNKTTSTISQVYGQLPSSETDLNSSQTQPKSSTLTGSSGVSSSGEGTFTLLISDEANDIGDFKSLEVTIIKIGVQKRAAYDADENTGWIEEELDPVQTVDLVDLQGYNSTIVFSDNLTTGEYTKVFIYVDKVEGILKTDTDNITAVKIPS